MPTEPRPRLAIPRIVLALRWVLFALLLAAAGAALLGLPRALEAGGSTALRVVPVALLVLFIAGYATYRFALVRAGRYSAGKALVQVGVMCLVLGVVAGIFMEGPSPVAMPGVDLAAPLASSDPAVRALAAEVCRHRPRADALRHVDRLVGLLEDGAPEVRREAHATLVLLAGRDAGAAPGAAEAWRALWRDKGLLPAAR
jgi:hypothetical protein